jgi:hypothetical protein
VGIELVAEVPDDAEEGEGGATLVVAKGAGGDVERKVRQTPDFVAARLTIADSGADLGQAAQADTAGNSLAAGFIGAEPGQNRS